MPRKLQHETLCYGGWLFAGCKSTLDDGESNCEKIKSPQVKCVSFFFFVTLNNFCHFVISPITYSTIHSVNLAM